MHFASPQVLQEWGSINGGNGIRVDAKKGFEYNRADAGTTKGFEYNRADAGTTKGFEYNRADVGTTQGFE
jgi:hypothetical protein